MLNVALIGAGGFGQCHLLSLKKLSEEGRLRLRAVCDVNPSFREGFEKQGILFFEDYRHMLLSRLPLDYVTVSTPIYTHQEIATQCLNSGFHVLLEKPPAILPEEFRRIVQASDQNKRACAVNYTMVADKGFQRLQQLLASAKLGRIESITGIGLYKRSNRYYTSPWIGNMKYRDYLLRDGTINNPLSHLLNNLLLLSEACGDTVIDKVEAELYRAHDITGEDTSCVRIEMEKGTRLLFYATLCNSEPLPAQIKVHGSLGDAFWQYPGSLQSTQGLSLAWPPEENPTDLIHSNMCDHLQDGVPLLMPLEKCKNTLYASHDAFLSAGDIISVPDPYLIHYEEEDGGIAIRDIQKWVYTSAEAHALFSETQCPWAQR